jgi:hypothetical protein
VCARHLGSACVLRLFSRAFEAPVRLRDGLVTCYTLCTFVLLILVQVGNELVSRLRTDFGICLDVIASCLSAVILSSECLLPCFQILSECIASLLVVCDTHNDLCRACQDEMDVERSPITSKITGSRFYALRVHATQAKQGSSALPPKQAQSVKHHQRFFHLIESRPAKHRIYCT